MKILKLGKLLKHFFEKYLKWFFYKIALSFIENFRSSNISWKDFFSKVKKNLSQKQKKLTKI